MESRIKDPGLADAGLEQIELALESMPVLSVMPERIDQMIASIKLNEYELKITKPTEKQKKMTGTGTKNNG